MTSFAVAPIFLIVESIILLVMLILVFSGRGRVARWLTPALALLAGVGLIVFLIYAFPAALIPVASTH